MNFEDLTPRRAIEMVRDDIEKELSKEHYLDSPDNMLKPILAFKECIDICNRRLEHIKDKDKVEINRCGCCKGELTDMTFCSRCTDYALHMANKWEEKQ